MLVFLTAFTVLYALLLFAECTSLVRGRHGTLWALLRVPAAALAIIPILTLSVPTEARRTEILFGESPLPAVGKVLPSSPKPAEGDSGASGDIEPEVHWLVHNLSGRYGVDPLLVLAMIQVESNFDPKAVSPRGAMGLMQINKITAKELGLRDPFDIRENLDGGIRYLQMLLERHRWDLGLALASYNAGPSAVERFKGIPPYRETRRYVWRVIGRYKRLKRMSQVFRLEAKPPALRRVLASTGREEDGAEKKRASFGTF